MTLIFHDSDVEAAGTAISDAAGAFSALWPTICDLGDESLNSALGQIQTTVNDSLLGAGAQLLRLGQAAIDAVSTWRAADGHLS